MAPVHYHDGLFPPTQMDWSCLIPKLGPASAAIAKYDGLLHAVPNTAILLSPLTTQEAVLSSKIEGTQATLGEVLEFEAGARVDSPQSAKGADIQEVLNYRRALYFAEQELGQLPVCSRLLKKIHAVLMDSVRGKDKRPGEFRNFQNWIGSPGCSKEEATFIPISPEKLADGIKRWELFAHQEPNDVLVQLAILHAEFEALHPFCDGNGRLGRLLIPLFLFYQRRLSRPMFYMSAFLDLHREEYYERLRAISRDNDWTGWVGFFLDALIEQAENNEEKARRILNLYSRLKDQIVEMTHSQYGVRALDVLFSKPVLTSKDFCRAEIPESSARRLFTVFREKQLLITLREGRGRQAGVYAFRELLNITEGSEIL